VQSWRSLTGSPGFRRPDSPSLQTPFPLGVCLDPARVYARGMSHSKLAAFLSLFLLLPNGALAKPPQSQSGLTLKDAWRTALTHSDDLKRAHALTARAKAHKRQILGAMLPSLTASGTYRLNDEQVSIGDRVVVYKHDVTARATLALTLFDGSAIPIYRNAVENVNVARSRADDGAQELLLQVTRAYYGALAAKRWLAVVDVNVKRSERYLKAAKERQQQGHAVRLDVARAEASLAGAERDRISATHQLTDARDLLALVMGLKPPLVRSLVMPNALPIRKADSKKLEGVAARGRKDLRALAGEMAMAKRSRTGIWLSFLPRVSVSGDTEVTREGFRDPDGVSHTVTVNLRWSIFDGGVRYGRLAEEAAALSDAQARHSKLSKQIAYDLRAARRAINRGKAILEATRRQEQAAQQSLAAADSAFSLGNGTGLDVLEAQSALLEAQATHIREQYQLDIARWTLERVLGKLAL
jgi:outer membrane protein TolC